MDNDGHKIKMPLVISVVLEFVFVIFIVISVISLSKQNSIEVAKLKIDNYSVIPEGKVLGEIGNIDVDFELDETKKSVIEGTLYDELLFNNVGNIYNVVKIREGSVYYSYISDLNVYILNFIVDVEDLGQSYHLAYRWSGENSKKYFSTNVPALAFCLDSEDLIYGDFECKDAYNGRGSDIVVHDLLQDKTFENSVVNLAGDVYNGERLIIHIYTNSDEESIEETAVDEVSSYLSNVGFDLEDFEYSVGTNFAY